MKRLLLTNILFLLGLGLNGLLAQSEWDGGAGTTNWEDGDNWNPNGVPAAGAVVTISTTVTITGTAANAPSRILVNSNNEVTLDLDLTIGDGTTAEHAVKVQSNATLNFGVAGNNRVFTINAPTNRYGIQHNANGSSAVINITNSSIVNIIQSDDGIRIEGTGNNVINNEGILNITNAVSDGIDIVTGSFINDGGTLNIDNANTNGINNKSTGTFINQNNGSVLIENTSLTTNNGIATAGVFTNASGTIEVDNANVDGIELSGGTFTNGGNVTISTTALNTDYGFVAESAVNNTGSINISGVDFWGIHVNAGALFTNEGIIMTNATGSGTTRHGLFVENGTFTNNGDLTASVTQSNARTARAGITGDIVNNGMMSLSGGNDGQRLRIEGNATNGFGAALDLGDGRVILEINASFTNNGLLLSTRASTPVYRNATGTQAMNNAFYDGNNGASISFSSGPEGTETDNGIDLNDLNNTQIDAGMSCFVDLAEQPYIWTDGLSFTATAAANGELDLTTADFPADPVMLTTTIQGTDITLEISNFCAAALPVELLTFTGTPMAKSVMLKWQTATEVNNDFMAVERSTDARTFTEIGRVAGAGNSNTILPYELEDEQPARGINYYRLRQVDTDGTTAFSNVIAVRYSGNQNNNEEPLIYPTLVCSGGTLYLDLRNDQSAQNRIWTVRNTHGQEVISFPLIDKGIAELSLPSLPAGLYLLTSTAGLETTTLKFLVTD